MLKLLVSLYLLCSLGHGFAFEGDGTTENLQFHTLRVSSMQPSSTCIPSTEGFGGGTYLNLVHKHGPCSPLFPKGRGNALSVFEALKRDQSRIDVIQSKITRPGVVTLPCDTNYIVTVGLGTPKKELSFSFDTGSYLTWTQCKAPSGHYFKQKHPLFDPSKSKTFTHIKCSSPFCRGDESKCSSSGLCGYQSLYGDNSTSEGDYGRDKLTLTTSVVIDNFLFGCSVKNNGIFQESEEDGMLGLSQHPFSIVQQTAKKHNQVFAYCIPSKPGFTGFLRFGGRGNEGLVYTPITNFKNMSYYGIDMIGISVGDETLPIPTSVFTKAGAIIDSGTGITRLPREIYIPFRNAYRKAMSKYKIADPKVLGLEDVLDTCHDIGQEKSYKIPKVSFLLSGGVAVGIPSSGIALPVHSNIVCFAFSGQSVGHGLGIIWGNVQQRTLEVVYDVGRRKIGFGYGDCK